MFQKIKTTLANCIAKNSSGNALEIFNQLEKPKNSQHGHLAFPCFQLAKAKKIPPNQYAEELIKELKLPIEISNVSALGPFLNFKINFEVLSEKIIENVISQKNYPKIDKTIVVEYSSPNIAKPFHVGHLRATLIGNCLDRLNRHLGYNVESINHLGDWGTQFGFVFAGCEIWGEPEVFSVSNLVELYKKATALKAEQEKTKNTSPKDVNQIARDYFLRLEDKDKEATLFWQRCVDVSLDYLKHTYTRLNIKFDHYLGESFYSDQLDNVKKDLESNNLLTNSEGAFGVNLGEELGFARILTPDGRSLYLTRDIAAVEYRFQRFKFDKSIYVVGAPQNLHFKQLTEILRLSRKSYAERIVHVAFGHVLGMKTRGENQAIELNDFIDEAISRALTAYKSEVQKRPEGIDENIVSEKVALAAIIFSTLNRTNIKDVHFSWDDALSFQGDSGPYLLYAHARLCGIEEKAKEAGIKETLKINYQAIDTENSEALLLKLIEFDKVLNEAANLNEPLIICTYALDLSKCISKAYMDLKVVGSEKDIAESRLTLFKAARLRLAESLRLLGIEPIEKM